MSNATAQNSINVLVVDDDPEFAEMTATVLDHQDDQLAVEIANGAEEGLSCLDAGGIDCIVSDFDMPQQNGLEFFTAIRERGFDVPFILFTGKGSEEIASQAISAGVTDYLQKSGRTEQFERLANRIHHATSARRSAKEARDIEAHFRAVVQNARDVILTIDDSNTIHFANTAVKSVFGYDPEMLEGKSLTILMPEEFRDRYEEGLHRYLQTGDRYLDWSGVEFPGLHRDGYEIPLSISFGEFIRDGERFFTGIIRDESERKKQEQALANARAIPEDALDAMEELFFVCDRQGSLLRWNSRLSAVTGYSDDALQSMQPSELFANGDVGTVTDAIEACLESGESGVQATITRANGEQLPCTFRLHDLMAASDDCIGVVGTRHSTNERSE